MRVVVTGGLGFIGSAVVRRLIGGTDHVVLNVDCGSYAATGGSVAAVAGSERYQLAPVDITDGPVLRAAVARFRPDAVVHLAAETHVDRSIDGPGRFVSTNIVGTYELLEAARAEAGRPDRPGGPGGFRFVHVSTDEVFGSLDAHAEPFDETSPYDPRSPYSASKAAADHLVRAWGETYGLPVIVTNCSNNYGPFQFPEKLIPLMIVKAVAGEVLPVYGTGGNIRDWLHVEDHARGIVAALETGAPGRTYAFGGRAERTNREVVEAICDIVDAAVGPRPLPGAGRRRELIELVTDRPGHDHRYAINPDRAARELGWTPSVSFEEGLARTVRWYLDNERWWAPLVQDRYAGHRLGAGGGPVEQIG